MARTFYSALSLDRIEPVSDGEAVRVLGQVLGNRLRAVREAKGLTQQDVASRVSGLTASALSNYERGIRDPDTNMLTELAAVYGVSTDYLLGLTDDPHLHSVKALDQAGTRDGAHLELRGEKGNLTETRDVPSLPDWVNHLPPEMKEFVLEESKHGWPYLRLARGLKMENISPEVARAIVETWMDAKKRYEKEFGPQE